MDTGLEEFMVPPEIGEKYGLEIMGFEDSLARAGLNPEDGDIRA
ncbi:MAG: hypothetical protein PHR03_02315 [Desulfovibrionales bacterium]|nr:hypothetical protein [Desulfovibrionales bacterium]